MILNLYKVDKDGAEYLSATFAKGTTAKCLKEADRWRNLARIEIVYGGGRKVNYAYPKPVMQLTERQRSLILADCRDASEDDKVSREIISQLKHGRRLIVNQECVSLFEELHKQTFDYAEKRLYTHLIEKALIEIRSVKPQEVKDA